MTGISALPASTAAFLAYVAIFIGALLAFEGLRQVFTRGETTRETRNRRLKLMAKGASSDEVLSLLLPPDAGKGRGFLAALQQTLWRAGLTIGPGTFLALAIGLGVFIAIAAARFLPAPIAAAASFAVTVLVPMAVLKGIAKARLDKLTMQLPDALDLMSRGLRVGHPLNVTVASVAADMPDPIGTEFGLIADQVSYGDDIATAFSDFADRTGLEDTRYLAVSVGIQHGTGGNLARVLKVLSKVIRDRATMRKKIHAISAEGRISALILSVLPFAIFGIIMMTTPSFYRDVQGDPLFMPFAIAIVSLVALQALILNRLVNFKF